MGSGWVGEIWAVEDPGLPGRGRVPLLAQKTREKWGTRLPRAPGPVTAKRLGERAEAAFLAKASGLGFGAAKPWGDSDRYDFILDADGRLKKVQVKSSYRAGREGLVRDANRQIRDTKARLQLSSTKGIILIANESNLYHDHPDSFRQLVAEVLRKRTPDGRLRFPYINGAVYFSLKNVVSRDEGMYFWANLQIQQTPEEDVSSIAAFQKDLQQAWYNYIEKTIGVQVRQHSRP